MLILVGLVFKNLRNSGMGSKIIRGRSPSSTRAPPPPPPTSKYYQQHRSGGARPQVPGRTVRHIQGKQNRH